MHRFSFLSRFLNNLHPELCSGKVNCAEQERTLCRTTFARIAVDRELMAAFIDNMSSRDLQERYVRLRLELAFHPRVPRHGTLHFAAGARPRGRLPLAHCSGGEQRRRHAHSDGLLLLVEGHVLHLPPMRPATAAHVQRAGEQQLLLFRDGFRAQRRRLLFRLANLTRLLERGVLLVLQLPLHLVSHNLCPLQPLEPQPFLLLGGSREVGRGDLAREGTLRRELALRRAEVQTIQ
mmetsp:Transcript_4242/g.9134  ORF Transcript_4242/g.9134 Transcript_4242/m.9134 type:complete len:235 (-) Transcript_4242:250-954(-)